MSQNNLQNNDTEEQAKKNEKKKLFDREHPMNLFLSKVGSLILANIFFVLCSIPVITIGASLVALNKVCYSILEESDVRVTPLFFRTFVKNLLDGILGWIIDAGFLSAFLFVIYYFATQGDGSTIQAVLTGLCGAGALAVLVKMSFFYAVLFRYDNMILTQIKNGFLIGFTNIGWSLVILLLWVGVIGVFYAIPEMLLYAGWLMLLVGFAAMSYLTCRIYRRVFRKLEKNGTK